MNFRECRTGQWMLAGMLAAVAPAMAQMDVPTTYIWDSGGQLSIARAGAWGNGAVTMSRAITYNGDEVLQMTTRNFSEGAVFDFTPPVDLASYQQNGFLRLRLRFRAAPLTTAPAVPGDGGFLGEGAPGFGAPNNFGAPKLLPPRVNFQQRPQPGGFGGAGGNFGGAGGFGGPGEGGAMGTGMMVPLGPPPQQTQLRRLQLRFVMERGVMSGAIDIPADLEKVKPDESGWRLFLLPLKDLRATPNAQGLAQRLIITGDKEDTFFAAQAALVIETGQMQASVRRPTDQRGAQIAEITVKPGLLTLVADVEAGTADPLIEWNFDADNVNPDLIPQSAVNPGGEGVPVGPDGLPVQGGFPGQGQGRFPGQGQGGVPGQGQGGFPRQGQGGFPGQGQGGALGAAPGQGQGGDGGFVAPPLPTGPITHARGLVAKFQYPNEEQDYRVEVTVTDRAGKKAPVKASILVHVRG